VQGQQSPPELLYVCVQDDAKIAVLDVASRELVRMIDLAALGYSANAKPHHIVVEPDGEHWYVSLIGDGRVVRFDREDRVVGQYETETPGMLAFDAGHGLLLASRSMSAVNPPSRVSIIEAGSMKGEDVEVFLPRPHPMVVTADGLWAYTGSLGENQLAAIDMASGEASLTTIEGPPHAFVQFALSPDESTLVAATELTGRLLVFDLADPANPALVASVEVGAMAFDPVFAPDGRSVWVPVKGENQVAIVDAGSWEITGRVEGDGIRQPHAIVFSSDGRRAFVTNNSKADHMADPAHAGHAGGEAGDAKPMKGNVTVLDTRTMEVEKVIELGANVTGMGHSPG
jgi:DNA-binding beta-propeller fold protein YncE